MASESQLIHHLWSERVAANSAVTGVTSVHCRGRANKMLLYADDLVEGQRQKCALTGEWLRAADIINQYRGDGQSEKKAAVWETQQMNVYAQS